MLIDLGLDRTPPVAAEPWSERAAWQRRRLDLRRSPRLRRWIAAVVVFAATVAGVGASAPAQPKLVPAFRLPLTEGGDFAIRGDLLYRVLPVPGGTSLTAYRLTDGAPQWSADMRFGSNPTIDRLASLYPIDDVIVIGGMTMPDGTFGDLPIGHTAAYDAVTGRLLWSREGFGQGRLAAGLLLMYRDIPPPPLATSGDIEHAAVDIRTGAVRWTLRQRSTAQQQMAFDWSDRDQVWRWMATAAPDGLVSIRDLITGEVVGTLRGDPLPPDGRLDLFDELLIMWDTSGPTVRLKAYDLGNLTPRWTAPAGREEYLGRCGPWICVGGDNITRALDPADGTVRWADTSWQTAGQPFAPWPEDLLVSSSYNAGRTRTALVDAVTGRVRRDLGEWQLESFPEDLAGLLLSRRPSEGAPSSFAVLPADLGPVEWLGIIDKTRNCRVAADLLICAMIDNLVQAWRIRRP